MKTVLINRTLPSSAEAALRADGYFTMALPETSALASSPLRSHPDMLLFYHNKTLITSKSYAEENREFFEGLEAALPDTDFRYTENAPAPLYPRDAIFNALVIGKRLFCKTDTVSGAVLAYAREVGLEVIHTNQGYPACTVLPLGASAAITADRGLARVLTDSGIRTYIISDSQKISLPPYEYGFIGGASGCDGKTVYFIGDIARHPDAELIKNAVESEGLSYRSLIGASPLLDLGRLIFC